VALLVCALSATSASASGTVWLCKPGLASNPCLSDETATIETGSGFNFVEHAKPAKNPPIDCFYVYPTVSGQPTQNANLNIDPEETQVAIDQASRFSQVCKVYAPIYPQVTLGALFGGGFTPEALQTAYVGVLSAWQDYLANFNHGRGVVLIGHSQGSGMLIQLLKEQFDPKPALRRQLVSAVLLGGDVEVPIGQTVGGSFEHVPSCRFAWETGCVVAYSSFLKEPPSGALFGHAENAGNEVVCVNPTLLVQGKHAGPLLSYASTTPFPGPLAPFVQVPVAPTPWVGAPGQYSAQCERAAGNTWLQVTPAGPPGDPREAVQETLGPLWGTHLADVNLALGNLVGLVGAQSLVYQVVGHS
jgi:hypothetical protein